MNNCIAGLRNIHRRWLYSCLLFFVYGCTGPATTETAKDELLRDFNKVNRQLNADGLIWKYRDSIQPGDMIARSGNDFTSYCFRQLCQADKSYSHCGIASIENDTVFIYHALGGEFNRDQRLLREPFDQFVSPVANNGFGIYRFRLEDKQLDTLLLASKEVYRKGIPFDMQFDLATDDKMYCSEFVAKMFRRAYHNDTLFPVSKLPGLVYLAPDNLFTNPLCRLVGKAVY